MNNSFTTQSSVNKPTTIASLSVRQHIGEHEDSYTDTTDKQRSAHSDRQSNHKRKLFIQSHPTNTIQDHHRKKKKKKKYSFYSSRQAFLMLIFVAEDVFVYSHVCVYLFVLSIAYHAGYITVEEIH